MKKIIFIALCLVSVQGFAQHEKKAVHTANGYYGGITTTFSSFNKQNAWMLGGQAGWLINHKLMLGLAGYATITRHPGFGVNTATNSRNQLRMGYGGLMVEYIFGGDRDQTFYITANTFVGAGTVSNGYKKTYEHGDNGEQWRKVGKSGFFIVQPGIAVEARLTDWYRISLGGGYRYISGAKLDGITNKTMSAPTASLTMKFGLF
ncbi:MAG TPA: hypothetical protein PLC48_00145 [Ferruginibacter sp.]|nr:hypothetical protein [Ferruginibacter sp.]